MSAVFKKEHFLFFLQRLQDKYDTAPDKYLTLQSIVESEIAENTNRGSKSCTLGLLWLKRCYLATFCTKNWSCNHDT